MNPFDLKDWQREIANTIEGDQYIQFYDGDDVCLDGWFTSDKLREIADVLDRINQKP